jgi:hypothetical protein
MSQQHNLEQDFKDFVYWILIIFNESVRLDFSCGPSESVAKVQNLSKDMYVEYVVRSARVVYRNQTLVLKT